MKNLFLSALLFSSTLFFGQTQELILSTEVRHDGLPSEIYQLLIANEGRVIQQMNVPFKSPTQSLWQVEVTTTNVDSLLSHLTSLQSIKFAEINHPIQSDATRFVPNDGAFGEQWYLDNPGGPTGENDADVDMPEAWSIQRGSQSVVLAIIDGGVQMDHPEFSGRAYRNLGEIIGNNIDDDNNGFIDDFNGWDFVTSDEFAIDGNGHGTAVAGIAAANGDDLIGFAGVDWKCRIMRVRVLDENGGGSYFNLAAALYYVGDNGVDVANMSLGGMGTSQAVQNAVEYAAERGVLLIAASGNRGDAEPQVPARYPEVMAVGAINWFNDRCAPYTGGAGGSSFGNHLDVMAPGDQIPILDYRDFNNYMSVANGTSLAAPIVSGIACLIKAEHPEFTASQIKATIELSAEDMLGQAYEDIPGRDNFYGYGRVNAHAALTSDFYVLQSRGNDLYTWSNVQDHEIIVRVNKTAESLLVTDIAGRILYQGENLQPSTLQVPISSSGVYMVSAIFGGERVSEKVILY